MNNGKNVLAVCDLEAAYACNFVEYVHRKNSMPFDIQAFTGLESLKAFAAKQKIEILLISDKAMCEEVKTLNQHNRQFEVPCLEQELILTHYRRPMEGETCIFVTNAQILARINVGLRQGLSTVKIGMVMSQAGFQQVRVAGKRGYRVVELTGDEIYRNQQAMGRFV